MKHLGLGRQGSLHVADPAHDLPSLRRVSRPSTPARPHYVRAGVMALILAVCLTAALFVSHLVSYPTLRVGDIATSTLMAPHDFSYEDTASTNAARARARELVPQQFRVDAGPQTQALSLASAVLRTAEGMNTSSSQPQAAVLVRASGSAIASDLARRLLALPSAARGTVRAIVLQALDVSAHQAVYPTQLPVLQAAPPFPATLPTGRTRTIAGQLYGAFLKPNRFPDAALSAKAQQEAAAQLIPIRISYQRGQVIVRSGDVVDAQALAALHAANMTGANASWQLFFADLTICLVVAGLLHGYLIAIQSPILVRPRQILLLDVLFLGSLLAASFLLLNRDLLPYVFPAAALSMLLTVLLNGELSMLAIAIWSILAGWYLGGSFEIATYYLATGLVGSLLVRKVRSSSQFFVAGLADAAVGFAAIMAFRLLNQGYDWLGFSTYAISALVGGGLAAALTLGSISLFGRLFGVTTAVHLLELSHPDHPLLRRLMLEAPGTYHHSMMIGNLAERAAEQIGADPLLVRVSAYFHDIGKLIGPTHFAENQAGIGNVHDTLDPMQSVSLIQQHVFEGVRLPASIICRRSWRMVSGSTTVRCLVSFFYQQAVSLYGEENVKSEDFRYPGPRPQSRETAILMLADGVEAAVRASPGVDGDQIRAIIHRLSQQRLTDGQLDECNLTLRDLAIIEESFATVLHGVCHPRVQYPAPLPVAAARG